MPSRLRRRKRSRPKALSTPYIDNPPSLRQPARKPHLRLAAQEDPAQPPHLSKRQGRDQNNKDPVGLAHIYKPEAVLANKTPGQAESQLLPPGRRGLQSPIRQGLLQEIKTGQVLLPFRGPLQGRVARRLPARDRVDDLARRRAVPGLLELRLSLRLRQVHPH